MLSVNGDDAFLVADKNLDVQKYNDTRTDVTWETCTMRSWLNGYGAGENTEGKDYSGNSFIINAFSENERLSIRTTNVVNDDNPYHDTEGGNDTSDQVYLLSLDEVMNPAYGFASNINSTKMREAINTSYVAGGGEIKNESMNSVVGVNWWWLRSSGNDSNYAAFVNYDGSVDWDGNDVHHEYVCVRPALHLNLSSTSSWSYAGTVTSKGEEKQESSPHPTEPGSTQKPITSAVPETTENPVQTGKSTAKPSVKPSNQPDNDTAQKPSMKPEDVLTTEPSIRPSIKPGNDPSAEPSVKPDGGSIGNVSAVKLKQKKQSVTVSWKKVAGAAGYQICYSTSKKWQNKKQKLSRKNKLIVKKLKKKKVYYFRVRAYRMNGSMKVYGAWSKVRKIKIKK